MMADEKGGYIPSDALLKIEHTANVQHEKWEQWLNSMPEIKQYEKLLNAVLLNVMLYAMDLGGGLERKIHYLKKVCYEKAKESAGLDVLRIGCVEKER